MHREFVWTFARRGEQLTISRRENDESVIVVKLGDTDPRTYHFSDPDVLQNFQHDMERFLLQTGWTLHHFSPDSRRGRDRRGFPRIDDRRRWWTDGTSPRSEGEKPLNPLNEDELAKHR